ncbi:MAG: hypothetical protein K0R94_1702 [Burkholderiales bacterium]|nr:hypothetical protein [Burkholderiales bacterium]
MLKTFAYLKSNVNSFLPYRFPRRKNGKKDIVRLSDKYVPALASSPTAIPAIIDNNSAYLNWAAAGNINLQANKDNKYQ